MCDFLQKIKNKRFARSKGKSRKRENVTASLIVLANTTCLCKKSVLFKLLLTEDFCAFHSVFSFSSRVSVPWSVFQFHSVFSLMYISGKYTVFSSTTQYYILIHNNTQYIFLEVYISVPQYIFFFKDFISPWNYTQIYKHLNVAKSL